MKVGTHYRITQDVLIGRYKERWGDRYDYSRLVFKTLRDKVEVVCPIHGSFWMRPDAHYDQGCRKCGIANKKPYHRSYGTPRRWSQEKFLAKAREVHGDTYDLSKVEYKTAFDKIIVVCKKHGPFEVVANDFSRGAGCSSCSASFASRGEVKVALWLEEHGIAYESQKRLYSLGCRGAAKNFKVDFFIPDFGFCIEVNGEQHAEPSDYFGGYSAWVRQINRDHTKRSWCDIHGFPILVLSHRSGFPPINQQLDACFEKCVNDLGVYLKARLHWADERGV